MDVSEHANVLGEQILVALLVVPADDSIPEEVRRAPRSNHSRESNQGIGSDEGATIGEAQHRGSDHGATEISTNSSDSGTEASLCVVVSKGLGVSVALRACSDLVSELGAKLLTQLLLPLNQEVNIVKGAWLLHAERKTIATSASTCHFYF